MRKLFLFALILFLATPGYAASVVSTDGLPNSSGTHPITVDSDRYITYATDAGIIASYEAATTSDTLTAVETGKTFTVDCATLCEFELPAAAVGMSFSFISIDNDASFSIDPNGTDTIKWSISNVPLDGGDKLTSPGATGDSITIFSTTANEWAVKNMHGTWTDGGS